MCSSSPLDGKSITYILSVASLLTSEAHRHISGLPGSLGTSAVSQEGPLQPVCLCGVPAGALHDP